VVGRSVVGWGVSCLGCCGDEGGLFELDGWWELYVLHGCGVGSYALMVRVS